MGAIFVPLLAKDARASCVAVESETSGYADHLRPHEFPELYENARLTVYRTQAVPVEKLNRFDLLTFLDPDNPGSNTFSSREERLGTIKGIHEFAGARGLMERQWRQGSQTISGVQERLTLAASQQVGQTLEYAQQSRLFATKRKVRIVAKFEMNPSDPRLDFSSLAVGGIDTFEIGLFFPPRLSDTEWFIVSSNNSGKIYRIRDMAQLRRQLTNLHDGGAKDVEDQHLQSLAEAGTLELDIGLTVVANLEKSLRGLIKYVDAMFPMDYQEQSVARRSSDLNNLAENWADVLFEGISRDEFMTAIAAAQANRQRIPPETFARLTAQWKAFTERNILADVWRRSMRIQELFSAIQDLQ